MNLSAVGVKREDYVIVLENLDFLFLKDKANEAVRLWEEGIPFPDMVDRLRPRPKSDAFYVSRSAREVEVFLLLAHLCLEEKIGTRPGALWGKNGKREIGMYVGLGSIDAWNSFVEDTGNHPDMDFLSFKNLLLDKGAHSNDTTGNP